MSHCINQKTFSYVITYKIIHSIYFSIIYIQFRINKYLYTWILNGLIIICKFSDLNAIYIAHNGEWDRRIFESNRFMTMKSGLVRSLDHIYFFFKYVIYKNMFEFLGKNEFNFTYDHWGGLKNLGRGAIISPCSSSMEVLITFSPW